MTNPGTEEAAVLQRLDALVATTLANSLPLDARWLDAESVGAMLSLTGVQVRQRLVARPDFPKPARIDGVGHPRWKASEITKWMKTQRNGSQPGPKGGRPRKAT